MPFTLGTLETYLPNLARVLPLAEEAVTIGEAVAHAAPAIVADITAAMTNPLAVVQLFKDLAAAIPTIDAAIHANTGTTTADSAASLNAAEAAKGGPE